MANETKVTDRNGDERIIKRSKLKIGIITLVVLILLSLIGVGIYFIIQATKSYEYDEDWTVASISEVRDDILDDDPNEIGVYFYSEGSTTSNFMLRDNTNYESGNAGAGALSEVITESQNQEKITWYGVEIPDENNELIEDLLTVKDDETGDYIFRDDFEYLGSGSSLRNGMWIMNTLAGSSDEFFDIEDATYSSFSFQVQNNEDDEDNPRDILFYDTSTTDGGDGSTDGGDTSETTYSTRAATGTTYSVQDGTTMFFNGSQLTGVVNSWETVEVSEDETSDDTADTRDDYHAKYVDWLNELIDHNTEFYS